MATRNQPLDQHGAALIAALTVVQMSPTHEILAAGDDLETSQIHTFTKRTSPAARRTRGKGWRQPAVPSGPVTGHVPQVCPKSASSARYSIG
jgi:hypothetical protein